MRFAMPTDPIRTAAEAAAHAVQADLLRQDAAPSEPQCVVLTGDRWTVTVTISPSRGRQSLDAVERDILAVLTAAGIPLPTSAVLSELARRGLDHSEITVKRRLAGLVRAGVIASRSSPPRGYCLPNAD